jgi:hypothetical protein
MSSELQAIVDWARDFCGVNRQTPSKTILNKRHRFLIIASLLLLLFTAGFAGKRPAKNRDYLLGNAICTRCQAIPPQVVPPNAGPCFLRLRTGEQGIASMVEALKAPVCSLRNTFTNGLGFASGLLECLGSALRSDFGGVADAEVGAIGMVEDEGADAGFGIHHHAFG